LNKINNIYEEVKLYLENLGYELISDNINYYSDKIIIKDSIGYYYKLTFYNIKQSNNLEKFYRLNPYIIQNIKLWCKLNNKPFELISDTYQNNRDHLKWKCLKDNCGEVFETSWDHIKAGRGCPYCLGQKVGLSNCLATKRPELAEQWHPTKNGDLTPYDVTCGSGKEVWWIDETGYEWRSRIASRYNIKHNKRNKDKNHINKLLPKRKDLLIENPELCNEWDYTKNINKPNEYYPNSNQKVWWKCKECGHEWEARVSSRNSAGAGCPQCNKSNGEKKIKNYFNQNIIFNIPQKSFNGLLGLGNGLLSYDFYLPQFNLLIEYQGEFHDGTAYQQSKNDFERQLEHDRRKREYAKQHNINLLEIWYWDFDNIEIILSDRIK